MTNENRRQFLKYGLSLGIPLAILLSSLPKGEALTLKPDEILINEASAPSTPVSGKISLYAKNTKRLFTKDSTGSEKQLNNYTNLDNIPSSFIPSAHQLDNATYHTVSGLTTNDVLTATSPTTFSFQAPSGGGGGSICYGYITF